ncbi:6-phosphogluconolactonase [Marinimicrobium koreense]|uniref:6-phosphogluconolactonase n=2 Tax=Marinimicrobium TaxID=359337 RepID=A0A3N1NXK7_9GAMM|nr:6-phosphogluconolactonase [Marinimicrobium koreense]ROQ19737.1 6-phosphogluconolactonase [Marinimicrobium koreense]
MLDEKIFDSREALLAALQEDCVAVLDEALKERDQASFLVSGGSSPAPLYQRLSQIALDWKRIQVALVDERWVEPGHAKSNETFVQKNLLQHAAGQAPFLGMKNSAETAAEGLAACEQAYQKLAQPFDLTILGMGPDGHTASLFPNAEGLEEALTTDSLCSAITAHQSEVTGEYTERMTLSLAGIVNSCRLVLLITGDEKLQALRAAQGEGPVGDMPIRAVLRQNKVPVTLYWAP